MIPRGLLVVVVVMVHDRTRMPVPSLQSGSRAASRRSSRAASEAGSVRSERITSIAGDALFPPRKEMAAGDRDVIQGEIPPPPNDEEPYMPIHPLLAK